MTAAMAFWFIRNEVAMLNVYLLNINFIVLSILRDHKIFLINGFGLNHYSCQLLRLFPFCSLPLVYLYALIRVISLCFIHKTNKDNKVFYCSHNKDIINVFLTLD